MQYEAFTDANPFMPALASAAEKVREQRKPASADNPFIVAQEKVSEQIVKMLDGWRESSGETLRVDFPRRVRIASAYRPPSELTRQSPGLEGPGNLHCTLSCGTNALPN